MPEETEIQSAAEEARSLRAQLGAIQRELAASRKESAEEIRRLQEMVKAREDFLTIASHELRNPLGVLLLQTQVLSAQVKRASKAGDLAAPVERLGRQMRHFVGRATVLLDVTRFLAGRIDLEVEHLDLGLLVRD